MKLPYRNLPSPFSRGEGLGAKHGEWKANYCKRETPSLNVVVFLDMNERHEPQGLIFIRPFSLSG